MDEDAASFLGECSGDSSLSSGFFFFPVFCFLDGLPCTGAVVSSCSSVGSSRSSSWSAASGFVRIAGGEGDLLDCLVIHLVALAAWDGQADVEAPEDLTCACPVELEVLDQAWDGPVDQEAAVCQVVEVHPLDWLDPSRCLDGHRLDSRRI